MLTLGIETSTLTCSVAVLQDDALLGQQTLNTKTTHSQKLLPCMDTLLQNLGVKKTEINLIGVAKGPGSFTGLRIGMATAKGLAYGLQTPIIGISTLEALAYSSNIYCGLVVPILNARRNQVYGAVYQYNNGEYLEKLKPQTIKLDKLLDFIHNQKIEAFFSRRLPFNLSTKNNRKIGG